MNTDCLSAECGFQILTKEVTKNTLSGPKPYVQIRYQQTKTDLVPKTELEKLESLRKKSMLLEEISKGKGKYKIESDWVPFVSVGNLEGKQNRLLINKEENIRRKYELQFQEKMAEKTETKVNPFANRIRVRIPDIPFFQPDDEATHEEALNFLQKQKEKFTVLIDSVMNKVRQQLNIDFKYNRNSMIKLDEKSKKPRLLDYVMIYFDSMQVAEEFVSILDGMTYNQFCLRKHVAENRIWCLKMNQRNQGSKGMYKSRWIVYIPHDDT